MAKRLKTITAGRLVVVGCYTIPTPRSTERERKALREISSAAQMTINANRSWQRLELLLAANFGRRDLHVVLTYDDEHLPANRQAAVQRVRKMLPQLRAVRKSRGQELKYIYVTEQLSSEGGRLHHHMVVNGTGADLDVLRSLWPYGEVELETLDTWQGYEALAKYLTKEPRELGKPEVGARNWAASIGLTKPKVESEIVKDNLTVAAPPRAIKQSPPPPLRKHLGEFITNKKEGGEERKQATAQAEKRIARASLFGLETRGNKSTGREKVHGKVAKERRLW